MNIEQNLADLKQAFSKAHTTLKVHETIIEFSNEQSIQVTIDGQPVTEVGGKITKLVIYQTPANNLLTESNKEEASLKKHILSCFNSDHQDLKFSFEEHLRTSVRLTNRGMTVQNKEAPYMAEF